MIRVLVADDHALMRMGLVFLFDAQPDIETTGEACDGADAVQKVRQLKPDVVVMDIMMPGLNGVEATARICRESPQTKVLCLTTSTSADEHRKALEAGAAGIVTKGDDNATILRAIRTIAAGGTFVSQESESLMADNPAAGLTARQLEILSLLAKGLRTKEIALRLGRSPETVRDRIDAACRKLGVSNRAEAVAVALHQKLIKPQT